MRRTRRVAPSSRKTIFLLFALVLACVLTPGCQENHLDYPARVMPSHITSDTAQVQLGRDMFDKKCASCHGKPSEGRSDRAVFFEPAAPDFTEAYFLSLEPAYLYWRIETGKDVEPFRSQGSVMPSWGQHFSEEQIWQLVVYIQSRAH